MRRSILITHDLGLIAELADRVVVMYAGRVVELGDVYTIFDSPRHPYTIGLMTSIARVDTDKDRLVPIPGQPPSLITPPPGCAFHPRCTHSNGRAVCRVDVPALRTADGGGRPSFPHATSRRSWPACATAVGTAGRENPRDRDPDRRRSERACHRRRRTATTCSAIEELVKHFPIKAGFFKRTVGQVRAVDGVSLNVGAGRDARRGRRVRMRKDDARTHDHEAASSRPRARSSSTARTSRGFKRKQMRRGPPGRPDRLPGSVRFAESPHDGSRHRRRAASNPRSLLTGARATGASRSSCARSVCPPSTQTGSRTSSPAASGSGSASHGRSRSTRG